MGYAMVMPEIRMIKISRETVKIGQLIFRYADDDARAVLIGQIKEIDGEDLIVFNPVEDDHVVIEDVIWDEAYALDADVWAIGEGKVAHLTQEAHIELS